MIASFTIIRNTPVIKLAYVHLQEEGLNINKLFTSLSNCPLIFQAK